MISFESTDDSARSSFSISDKKRCVSFAETASIRIIDNLQAMSGEELRNTWYRKSEFEDIKKSMIPLIKALMRGDSIEETDEVTYRGLEYRTRKGALMRQHNKVISITSVLDEQDRQRCVGDVNSECIRNVYLQNSAHCLVAARQLGIDDEDAIQNYMDIDEPIEAPIDDYSSCGSDDSSLSSNPSQQKFKGFNKIVKTFRRRQQALYDDLAGLVLPTHFNGMPQAA
ncbi:hypothetical protein MPSEU_000614600 [Mayamaea pseudoterrestris]|nr:hypothetical protein MPSEU_000614600 [Mayamaea pseudoterrestris]